MILWLAIAFYAVLMAITLRAAAKAPVVSDFNLPPVPGPDDPQGRLPQSSPLRKARVVGTTLAAGGNSLLASGSPARDGKRGWLALVLSACYSLAAHFKRPSPGSTSLLQGPPGGTNAGCDEANTLRPADLASGGKIGRAVPWDSGQNSPSARSTGSARYLFIAADIPARPHRLAYWLQLHRTIK